VRRLILALLLGSVVFAITWASAATLTVNNATLGAGSSVTSSCDPDVNISYGTTYTGGTGYTVSSVTVAALNTAACAGNTIGVTLADAANGGIGSGTAPVPGTGDTATVPIAGAPPVTSVANVHVVIG
jgi:hypothetical protein